MNDGRKTTNDGRTRDEQIDGRTHPLKEPSRAEIGTHPACFLCSGFFKGTSREERSAFVKSARNSKGKESGQSQAFSLGKQAKKKQGTKKNEDDALQDPDDNEDGTTTRTMKVVIKGSQSLPLSKIAPDGLAKLTHFLALSSSFSSFL